MPADLSVVMPVRDGAATIGAALASIAARAEGLAEIVVVDDGSADGSADVARAADARVRVLRLEGGGIGAARNAGVAAARGPLLAFLDADDEWLAGAPDPRREALAADPGAIVLGAVEVVEGERASTGPLWSFGAALMRRETWERVGPVDRDLTTGGDDVEWFLRARDAGVPLVHVADPVLRYVRRAGSMSGPDPGLGLLRGLNAAVRRRAAEGR